MNTPDMLIIDGSFGEGGGQILRNAIALSIMTEQTIRITNIRANRANPGLRPQHLTTVRAAARICGADVEGDEIGSIEIDFVPGEVKGGKYELDIGTAGSVTLLLQGILAPLLSADRGSVVRITGGTDVPWSPPVDYLSNVMLPLLRRMGGQVDLEVERRGFYPRGGGTITVRIEPSELKPLILDRGYGGDDIRISIEGTVFICELPDHIAERMRTTAESMVKSSFGDGVTKRISIDSTLGAGPGTGITLWSLDGEGAEHERPDDGEEDENDPMLQDGSDHDTCWRVGSSALGKRGVKAEAVGRNAALELIRELEGKGSVDIHAADQLPVFLPLIRGLKNGSKMHYSVREISGHLRTGLWVLEQFGFATSTLFADDSFQIMLG